MRESRTYGFVRGAHSNMRPYRDPYLPPIESRITPNPPIRSLSVVGVSVFEFLASHRQPGNYRLINT